MKRNIFIVQNRSKVISRMYMFYTMKITLIPIQNTPKKKKLPFHFVIRPLAQLLQSLCTQAVQMLEIPEIKINTETQNNERHQDQRYSLYLSSHMILGIKSYCQH